MFHNIIRAAIAGVVIYILAGCGAVEEAANEGANAFNNGMKSADRAEGIAEKKEAFDSENDL